MNDIIERLKEFRGDLKLTSSWLFAAFVSLGVNLIFSAIYAVPQSPNIPVFAFGLGLFIVFIILAVAYLPSDLNLKLIWSPGSTGWLFDSTKSQQIINSLQSQLLLPLTSVGISSIMFSDSVTPFAHLICLANLRDSLNKKQLNFLKVTSAWTFGGGGRYPNLLLTINVKRKYYLAISRNVREKIEKEAFELASALGEAKQTTGVYAFDYDPASWQRFGHIFLNDFFTWNVNDLERILLRQIIGAESTQ